MKKSVMLTVLIVSVALLTTGCDTGGKADFYPMGVGSIWNYSWQMIVADTTVAETTDATVKTEAVKEDELASGEKAIMLVITVTAGGQTVYVDTSYARKDGEKVISYDALDDSTPQTTIDGPLAVDKTWTVEEGTTAKVVAQEDVMVPAGTYKKSWKVALTTVTDQDTTVVYHWLADGTGPIKQFESATDEGVTTTMTAELTSATIK